VVLVALVVVIVLAGRSGKVDCDGFRLDSARWSAEAPGSAAGRGDRHAIARSLAQCETLRGKSKPEIEAALGRPLERARRFWSYPTGRSDDLGDSEYLYVNFDRAGRVRSTDLAGGEYEN
jgi:hypothetical protein